LKFDEKGSSNAIQYLLFCNS